MRQFLTVMNVDFKAKSKDWCSIDITSSEGSELDFFYYSVWYLASNKRTDTYSRYLEILYRLDIHIST